MEMKEFVEYETGLESIGSWWMTKYGVKTFKDYTGEWVGCSNERFFDSEFEVYPHLTMETMNDYVVNVTS